MRSSTWCFLGVYGRSNHKPRFIESKLSVTDARSALLVTANTISLVLTCYIHIHMVYEQINEVLTWKKTQHMLRFNLLYDHIAVRNVSQLFCWSLSVEQGRVMAMLVGLVVLTLVWVVVLWDTEQRHWEKWSIVQNLCFVWCWRMTNGTFYWLQWYLKEIT